ncbi:cytochrome c maturation protein CcmE [Sphingosinicellaceae bacterium]|nr:cytochrome c maturation protein CcmE [Sphingosinicellaceae bacterium]
MLCTALAERSLGARKLDLLLYRVDNALQAVRVGPAKPIRDRKRITRLLCDRIETWPVTYIGILPDIFREGQGVIAEGKIDPGSRIFTADTILATHDEKYMPPEVAGAMHKATARFPRVTLTIAALGFTRHPAAPAICDWRASFLRDRRFQNPRGRMCAR